MTQSLDANDHSLAENGNDHDLRRLFSRGNLRNTWVDRTVKFAVTVSALATLLVKMVWHKTKLNKFAICNVFNVLF